MSNSYVSTPSLSAQPITENWNSLLKQVAETKDMQAFEKIYNYFTPKIKAYGRYGGLSSSTLEEYAQEVMLRLWRFCHLFEAGRGSAEAFIFKIARNLRVDFLRQASIAQLEQAQIENLQYFPFEQNKGDYDIINLLSVLSVDQRKIVHAAFIEGETHEKIAEKFNIPLGTVKSRLRLSFSKLRKIFED
ncbi:MAG: sigma-70 family RNA polymerase sigma factor [Alphaproteobacteria bacterium]